MWLRDCILFLIFDCLYGWRFLSIHSITNSVVVFISPTHIYVFLNYDLLRFPASISCNFTKVSFSTCARSSKYKYKSNVWQKVNRAEEVCMLLFLTQLHYSPFHCLSFSYRSEIASTFLVFMRSLQVPIQSANSNKRH